MAPRTKFTPENRAVLIDRVRVGVSFAEACRDLEIRVKTAEGWVTRGRRDLEAGDPSAYADFAVAIEEARAEHERVVLTLEEFEKHLARQVRGGSVQAIKLWWDIHGKKEPADPDAGQPEDPFDALEADDELARKRDAKAG